MVQALWTAAQAASIDRLAQGSGLGAWELMQRAGLAAWQLLRRQWPLVRNVVVVLGKGNNAGDGLVLAAHARRFGLRVRAMRVDLSQYCGTAADAEQFALCHGVIIEAWDPELLKTADVVVDALLGIGLSGPPAPAYAAAIHAINRAGRPVFSMDVPSGLDVDRGSSAGDEAVRATLTLCFLVLKRGLFTGPGEDWAGRVVYDDLGFVPPQAWVNSSSVHELHVPPWPSRLKSSHKGLHGRVVVVGGLNGMSGAAVLTASAVARAGAGWVHLVSDQATCQAVLYRSPEIMTAVLAEQEQPDLPGLEQADLLVVGPGLGRTARAKYMVSQALACEKPLVLDADALYFLEHAPPCPAVLTPHPGEAAHLLGCSSLDVQKDRFSAAASMAARYQSVVILKGNGTLIALPDGRMQLCRAGNPAMASPGMGDVLAGMVAGIWAQCKDPFWAARMAVLEHARLADQLVHQGRHTLQASDLVSAWQGPGQTLMFSGM